MSNELLNDIQHISHDMLAAATAGEWDKLAELQITRQELFDGYQFDQNPDIHDFLQGLLDVNNKILKISKEHHRDISGQLIELKHSQKAIQNYLQSGQA